MFNMPHAKNFVDISLQTIEKSGKSRRKGGKKGPEASEWDCGGSVGAWSRG